MNNKTVIQYVALQTRQKRCTSGIIELHRRGNYSFVDIPAVSPVHHSCDRRNI